MATALPQIHSWVKERAEEGKDGRERDVVEVNGGCAGERGEERD